MVIGRMSDAIMLDGNQRLPTTLAEGLDPTCR
jgi:hypothetical protein